MKDDEYNQGLPVVCCQNGIFDFWSTRFMTDEEYNQGLLVVCCQNGIFDFWSTRL